MLLCALHSVCIQPAFANNTPGPWPLVVTYLISIPLAIWSLIRAAQLIAWGTHKSKLGAAAPDYLSAAKPIRLIVSGSLLLMMTLAWATFVKSNVLDLLPNAMKLFESAKQQIDKANEAAN